MNAFWEHCVEWEIQFVCVLQLMRLAFDEEVSADSVEVFRKLVNKCRNPATVFHTFAFTGYTVAQPTTLHKQKEKNKTLRWVVLALVTAGRRHDK